MKVFWTPRAKKTYMKVLGYLHENWGIKEVEKFVEKTEDVIKAIETNPQMFIGSPKKKNVFKGLVTKHNSLYYRVKPKKKEISLLTFWDNRQNPEKNNY